MKNGRRLVTAALIAPFIVAGCGGSKQVVQQPAPTVPVLSERQNELRHDRALSAFVDGCGLDAKGEYAEAILEYQEALQYDQIPAIYHALSRDYALLGKPAKAAETGREAVRMEPRNIAYRENLAAVYLTAFQQDLAINEYEQIIAIDSNYWSGWYNLARLVQNTKPLRALEIYEKLLDRNGDEWSLLLMTAELYGSLGRHAEAAAKFRRMLELDPGDRALQRQLAESYSRAGNNDEAVRILEKMLEVDDRDLDVCAVLAEVYLTRSEFSRALPLFNKLTAAGIQNTELKLRVGVAMFGQASRDSAYLPKARQLFEELRNQAPRDWRAYWYLGAVAGTEHKDSLAASYFSMVTKLDERNGDAWWFVGTHLFDKGEYRKLLEEMDRARKVLPNDARVYFLTGLAYTRLDEQLKAVEALEQSYKLNPKDINTLSTLALAYDGLKRFADSDRLYEEALLIDSSSHLILNNYGYSLADRGLQLQRALEMAKRAVAADPENSSYLDTIGWIYFRLGQFDDARRFIERAVAKDSASATVIDHLGDICFKLGQKVEAEKWWKKALELNPKNAELQMKIDRGGL